MMMRKLSYILLMIGAAFSLYGQVPDKVYRPNIRTVKLYPTGNQLGYPAINLNKGDQLEIHFDDMDADVKNYFYTFQLCNADWSNAPVSQFNYLKGFTQVRFNNYRMSSVALTRYTHYQSVIPERGTTPTMSGNYLLKVFLDGDTSKVAFTRRFLVVDSKVNIGAQVQQTFNPQVVRTHHKIQLTINTASLNVTLPNQQVKVVILQNNRWDNSLKNILPTFLRQNSLEFNAENDCIMPAGKEWRWLDLRSLRFQSDRILKADYGKTATEIFMQPDLVRNSTRFIPYQDLNGLFAVDNTDGVNPFWQSDYARVNFSFFPPNNTVYADKDVYVFGELTNYSLADSMKMRFNTERGCYETSLYLKQGFYSYNYATTNRRDKLPVVSFDHTEGNYWETENNYTILVYYRTLGGRNDELVGYSTISSLPPGIRRF
jgi:Domain of unknown function (DUF5103)